jgi:ribosomal protein S18 acetylase RimI-like enzyme
VVSIRPFEKKDNANILDMEKLCPQGNEKYAMGADKSPDAAARYDLYDNSKFLVAEEEEKVVGSIGWAVKHPLKGDDYVYLTEVNVHPDFRNRGIASKLVKEVEKDAIDKGADHIYCYIFEPNNASKALFTNLGYSNSVDIKACALSVYKKVKTPERFKIELLNTNEIQEVVDLINNYYEGREHFVPYTTESFKYYLNKIPDYGLENFWVVKSEDEIVACAGLWDSSKLARICFSKEPFYWKVMQGIFGFLSIFTKMPKIPAEGEYFNLYNIVDHAFKSRNFDAMAALIGHFNNHVLDAKGEFFIVTLDPNDVLLDIIQRLRPQIDNWSVFVKSFEKELNDFNQIYVDIRDMIL